MLNRKNGILIAAALAAIPTISRSAVVTYSFDMNDFYYSTTKAASSFVPVPAANISGTSSAPIVTVPVGDYLMYGVDASVTNNGGLGLTQFTAGVTDLTPTTAGVYAGTNASGTVLTGVTIPTHFSFLPYAGQADGTGGIQSGGNGTSAGYPVVSGDTAANVEYGVGAPQVIFSTVRIQTIGANGTQAKFTLTGAKNGTSVASLATGTVGTSSATYTSHTLGANDSFGAFPTLTINIGTPSTVTTSAAAGHPIVSLLNTAPPAYYGSQLGSTISVQPGGNGVYTVGYDFQTTSNTSGFVITKTWNPITDSEVYALKVQSNGATLTTAQITALVTDLNAANGSAGVVASAIPASFAGLFPASAGWDLLLTSAAGFSATGGQSYLGIDFSQDTDALTPSLTVSQVAAVPEPATAAGIVLGAAGLLLGRRKSKALVA